MDTVHVYDTWVNGKKGRLQFDVVTTSEDPALTLAKQYLTGIGELNAVITLKECQFFHSEPIVMFFGSAAAAIPRTRRVYYSLTGLIGNRRARRAVTKPF